MPHSLGIFVEIQSVRILVHQNRRAIQPFRSGTVLDILRFRSYERTSTITIIIIKGVLMKRILSLALAIGLVAFFFTLAVDTASAQTKAGQTTTAPGKANAQQKWGSFDDDGDGIINCQDPDYVRPMDGTGKKLGKMHGGQSVNGKGGNGLGTGVCTGTGVCDGTGPKGKGRGK